MFSSCFVYNFFFFLSILLIFLKDLTTYRPNIKKHFSQTPSIFPNRPNGGQGVRRRKRPNLNNPEHSGLKSEEKKLQFRGTYRTVGIKGLNQHFGNFFDIKRPPPPKRPRRSRNNFQKC